MKLYHIREEKTRGVVLYRDMKTDGELTIRINDIVNSEFFSLKSRGVLND